MKLLYLDFEFNGISEKNLNLVCVSATAIDEGIERYQRDYWLLDYRERVRAKNFFTLMKDKGYIFVSYVVEAEQRSLMSLFEDSGYNFYNPSSLKWIDLYLEYRNLLNHNHKFQYGEQLIEGKVKKTKPPKPKWEQFYGDGEEDESVSHHKPSYSLAAAVFKLLGSKVDTEEKTAVRDIIIRSDTKEIEENQYRIMKYCRSDIEYLRPMMNAFIKENLKICKPDEYKNAMLKRGEYAARSAMMISCGYPVNRGKIENFKKNIPEILASAQEACNEFIPAFSKNKKTSAFKANENTIRTWVTEQKKPHWRMTDKGKVSISKDAFADWYDSESEGFAGAYCRYLKTKQSLNGFMPNSKKKFEDFVGSDNRVRPFMGIYGAQSSRSQPASAGFIPLKSHWMRNFIESPKGLAMVGIDYASQEFLLAAIISQDEGMMDAYESGDVYLAFAKAAGLAPKEATKESHKETRDKCKTLVLGISYDMGSKGLAARMGCSESEAEGLIQLFYDTYEDYADWKKETLEEYREFNYLKLSDGWTIWGDNPNHRSVGNFPIQGAGAVVMREAVRLCQVFGIRVVYTLHDAVYAEIESKDLQKIQVMQRCMLDAFRNVMKPYGRCPDIRLEGECWSQDFTTENGLLFDNIKQLIEYSDSKGASDLKRYRKFFN